MRVLFNRVRQALSSRLWAWPTVTGIIGAIAAVTLGSIVVPTEAFLARFLWPGDASSAASMLSFIASATLTVLTTTISMTLIVMQVASGNFSHQLLSDFISSRAVRGILAVYVGVFTYTLLLLRSLDTKADRPPQLAMTVSMLLVFAAVATFIWYLSRVVDMVRVDSIIDESARRTLRHAEDAQKKKTTDEAVERPAVPDDAQELRTAKYGYVRAVDTVHARQWALDNDATVVVDVRPGDAVVAGQTLARYWGMPADEEGGHPKLPQIVYLDLERVSGQDFSLGLRQIYDIAVRALSPGTNDPTTAQHAIGLGSTVLRNLARNPIHPTVRWAPSDGDDDEHGRLVVWAASRPVSELLSSFVGGVRRYANHEPDIYVALLRLLGVVIEECEPEVRAVARQERDRIVAAAERLIDEPHDLHLVTSAAQLATLSEELPPEEGL